MLSLTAYTYLFTLATIGVSVASYLIQKRKADERPICPIGEDCHIVLESKYNQLLGIRNDILGLAFYTLSAIILGIIFIYGENSLTLILNKLFYLMLTFASAMSIIFIYLQSHILKAWCFWCIMSSLIVFLMDIIVFFSII